MKKTVFAIIIILCSISIFSIDFDPGKSRPCKLFFYRPKATAGVLAKQLITINQAIEFELDNDSYFEINVQPGEYLIYYTNKVGNERSEFCNVLQVFIEPGEVIYVQSKGKMNMLNPAELDISKSFDAPSLTNYKEITDYQLLVRE